jgi:hypothetical protein
MMQSAKSRSSEFRPGDVLRDGRYEIQRLLQAACGKSVYLAQDRVLGCQVTVGAFSNDSSIVPGGLTVSAWETLVLGQLGDHPNFASVLKHWDDGKTAFMPGQREGLSRSPAELVEEREDGVAGADTCNRGSGCSATVTST